MRRHLMTFAVAAAVALPAGAASAQEGAASDVAAIEALLEGYSASQLARDADAWLALWDDGGVQMPPGRPARGVDVLRELVPQRMAAETMDSFNIRPEETVVAGDWAWTRGTYDADGTAEGGPFHVDGKYLTILKRQADGSWKIYRDAFNSNIP